MGRHIQSSFICRRWRLWRLSYKGDSFPSPIFDHVVSKVGASPVLTTLD
jgi:hypothetical protein